MFLGWWLWCWAVCEVGGRVVGWDRGWPSTSMLKEVVLEGEEELFAKHFFVWMGIR